MRRVCLVGAGFIAHTHVEVLQTLAGIRISAIVDPSLDRGRSLARQWGIAAAFPSVDLALAEGDFDCAHVLVPPNHHCSAALPFLAARKPVFMEKPLAASSGECKELLAAAQQTVLGVNQNFVFHPAFLRLREMIRCRAMGPPRFLQCLFNMPLRQLAARQFGHWMFDASGNILLEQAVHPLSQIVALGGDIEESNVLADAPLEPVPGINLYPTITAALRCRDLSATLRFAVGESFPCWQMTVICDDGVITADMLSNSVLTSSRTRWIDGVDAFVSGHKSAAQRLRETWRNALDYGRSTLRMTGRRDPFFQSMKASIAAFHAALDAGITPETDGRFGAALVRACEAIRDQLPPALGRVTRRVTARTNPPNKVAVAVIGGTGFIGTHLMMRLIDANLDVAVMARNLRNLPAAFQSDTVVLHGGDIRNAGDVADAIEGADTVVNLAHGGGGRSWEEIRDAMVGGTASVAKACLAGGIRRLIHVGSVASLYLGSQAAPVTGRTPTDPRPESRADYARAKILCDRLLLDMHAREHLPVCILRPAIVVGEGGTPFHSALGFYNNEQHCIGWNAGRNPLPFVCVEDVADAIMLATRAEGIEGRCYNLVGDVRLTASEYIEELGRALGRPLRFHPKSPMALWLEELFKWSIKRMTRHHTRVPTRHDILSRGMTAQFDCSDVKQDLRWQPTADRETFIRRAILIHAAQIQ